MFFDCVKLWTRLGAQSDAAPVFQDLHTRYAERHRYYHNLKHIGAVLVEFASAREFCAHPDDVEVAAWFHDAIYDPKAKDNEEQSAKLCAHALLNGRVHSEIITRVHALILATKHTAVPANSDAAVLVDADLSILGQPKADFDAYEVAIRQEYAWVDEAAFREGRAAILQSFLDRPKIFTTDFFAGRYEAEARKNLRRSLRVLRAK